VPEWQNQSHFFAIASWAMRQILVDHTRLRGAHKRGAAVADVSLDEALVLSESQNNQIGSARRTANVGRRSCNRLIP
jgi:hypothetical protein